MLTNKEIDLIRDSALKLENSDLKMAHDLMAIAFRARPHGPLINKKLTAYRAKLSFDQTEISKLQELVDSGEVAIIPVGLRCYTKVFICEKLGIRTQASLPFDSGFFTPNAVASVLNSPRINLSIEGEGKDHSVCIKTEKNNDDKHGYGIKFESSTYKDINAVASSRDLPDINSYLDSTFGFYTLDIKHQFVLAHYNWHPLSSEEKSNGIVEPQENLKLINQIMERRIQRMMEMIDKSKHVIFVFGENQNYQYLQIDDVFYPLNDFEKLRAVCFEKFGDKFTIVKNIYDGSFKIADVLNCL